MTTPPVRPPVPQNPYAQPLPPQGTPGYAQQQQYAPPAPPAPGYAQQQYAPPMAYGRPSCRFCGSVPAVNATIRGHQGLLIMMRFLKLRGPFCRRCGIAVHRDMTAKSLWQGWWGLTSMLINPITMLISLEARSKINKLPEPIPGGSGTPMDPGKPILRRPAALLLLLPVVVFSLFIGLIVLGAQSDPEFADVGDCVYDSGGYGTPDMIVADCSSSQAEYKIVGKLEDTPGDSGCEAYSNATVAYREEYRSSKYVLCLAPKS